MKSIAPVRHTIRFRRWSRKAYAAFASIGRCVTIGCLPKCVADSSLSKQKATGAAGHAGCEEDCAWKGVTKGRENDMGIPIGNSLPLPCGIAGSEINRLILLGAQVNHPCVHTDGEEECILKQRNYRARIIRTYVAHFFKPQDSDNPCLFHIHEFIFTNLILERYDSK